MTFGGYFRNRTVLVTGVAGVKGTWLALELLEAGADVVGVDIEDPNDSLHFRSSGLSDDIRFLRVDVADADRMMGLVDQVDALFHLAAVSLVGEARRHPVEAYRTNLLGTVTVLEAFRRSSRAERAVIVTTDKVYQPSGAAAWRENDPLFASGPYAVSKACADAVAGDYHRTYLAETGKRLAVGRAGNVIVGGDFHSSERTGGAGRLFVDCYLALMRGRAPVVLNPGQRRAYLYGLDVVAGYMALMSNLDRPNVAGEAFNFGPVEPRGVDNATLATRICAAWGESSRWTPGQGREEPFQDQALVWDKARTRLHWQPAFDLETTLAETTAWYRAWQTLPGTPGAMRRFDLDQVRRHRQRALEIGIPWARD